MSFPAQYPVAKQLGELSVDLTGDPTLGELLHQLRGEEITLDGGKVRGTIVGVEIKQQQVDAQVMQRDVLNLLTQEGLRAVPLATVGSVQLLNDGLDQELRDALRLISVGRRTSKKTVHFTFAGDGHREVRIGYVRATPLWKTSYRLVLSDGQPSLLQGWAIVENTGESNWDKVDLTLMRGRPVTFEMDLYRPLLVQRQKIEPSVPPSLASRIYSPKLGELDVDQPFVTSVVPVIEGGRRGFGGGFGGGGFGGGPGRGMSGKATSRGQEDEARKETGFDPGRGVTSRSAASDVGEQFEYKIDTPITLAQRNSAMIPIVNQEIKTAPMSVFTVGADSERPMLAVRLTNSSDLRLVQGPVTVFEDGRYAGDARVEFLRPGESRLVSYAQDTSVRVRLATDKEVRSLDHSHLDHGVLVLRYAIIRKHRYRFGNQANQPKSLLLEHPRDDKKWRLQDGQKLSESTESYHRFEVALDAKSTAELVVEETRSETEKVDLAEVDLKELEILMANTKLEDAERDVIRQIRELRHQIADTSSQEALLLRNLRGYSTEQARIRENMQRLDRDSELYLDYVEKLTKQEDRIEKTREAMQASHRRLVSLRKDLKRFFPSTNKD